MSHADIGVIGLAVMGQNLVLNMADHGFKVVAYNRTAAKVTAFIEGPAKGKSILGATTLAGMISMLNSPPRRVMLMVKAGHVVDEMIAQLVPLLEAGDILIDGGNSHYKDTERRQKDLARVGILYVGSGISGGEEGARKGPSLMPGGDARAWPHLQNIFQTISAHTDRGEPCCDWVGNGGAGHFVKMVHNGIEYGDMQLIAEAWQLLRLVAKMSDDDIASIFARWDGGDLSSYLIEITADILTRKEKSGLLVDSILDVAGQKGTGKWTGINALDLGTPLTLITEAVYARSLSTLKDERVQASHLVPAIPIPVQHSIDAVQDVHDALLASKMISYAQGFMLMRAAAAEQNWSLDFGAIASLWRGGCIIRSGLLEHIREAFHRKADLSCLMVEPWFADLFTRLQPGWRRAVSSAIQSGVAIPAMSSALCFFDGYRSEQSGANLLQAQRDYFGAHSYERVDRPRGEFFHTDWIRSGAFAKSGSYTA